MKGSRFWIFLGVLFLIAVVVYATTTPHSRDIPMVGIVTANEAIVSPQVTGRITHLYVDEGSEVKTGQLIADLDPTDLQAALASAQANAAALAAKVGSANATTTMTDAQTAAAIAQAQATLANARAQLDQSKANLQLDKITYERDEGLFKGGALAAQDRDNAASAYQAAQDAEKAAEAQVNAATDALAAAQANRQQLNVQKSDTASTQAQLAQARAEVAQAQTQLGYTKIYSPLDGVVSVRAALQGEMVQVGAPIVTVIDIDHPWVEADVQESYEDDIQFGQKLTVQFPSGNKVTGTVYFKAVENDYATQRDVSRTKRDIKTFAIKVSIPNPGRRLFAGMTATVLLPPPPAQQNWLQRLLAIV
ncbi:MAG: efflux RND transporter periplasmic adaptor subunit [Candidatus Acidiferrales bacterium]